MTLELPDKLPFSIKPAQRRLLLWYRANKQAWPWRQLHKKTKSPYPVWVSEIMLQQTVIKAVLPKYEKFMQAFPDIHALAQAEESEVRKYVAGLGYYRRFNSLHKAAKLLSQNKRIRWPKSFAEWKELPGIGDYTAAAISSIAFGQPHAVVDGNVERVLCRLLDIQEAPNQPFLKKHYKRYAGAFIDRDNPGDFNQAIMELGQKICTPTSPQCENCPIKAGCQAFKNNTQHLAPGPKLQKKRVSLHMRLIVFKQGKKIGLVTRPEKAKFLKGYVGFYTQLQDRKHHTGDGWETSWDSDKLKHCGSFKHGITHHDIQISVHECHKPRMDDLPPIRWVEHMSVKDELLTSLDRKAYAIATTSG